MDNAHEKFKGPLDDDRDVLLEELVMYILSGAFTHHRRAMIKSRAMGIWRRCYKYKSNNEKGG